MIDFSIVITTYNSQKYIKRCLNAIIKQKENHNIEVLIVDDGSKDNTVKICQEYSQKYSYIRLITHDNAGVSVSRNIGVQHSQGKWIMFIDSDDYILDNTLNVISSYLNTDADVIFFKYEMDGEKQNGKRDSDEIVVDKDQLIRDMLIYNNYQGDKDYQLRTVWAKLFKREYLEDYHIESPVGVMRGQDAVFMLEVFSKASKVLCSSKTIYHYFFTVSGSITNAYKPHYERIIQSHINAMKPLVSKKYFPYYENYRLEDVPMFLKFDLFDAKNNETIKTKKRRLRDFIDNGNYIKYYQDSCANGTIKRFKKTTKLILFIASHKQYQLLKLLYVIKKKI